MAGTIAKLQAAYKDKGFVVVGPTQRYGYTKRGQSATPEQEMPYIEQILAASYTSAGVDMFVPVSSQAFVNWGSSTSPTVVLIGRDGVVRMYHPGQMTEEELEPRVKELVDAPATAAAMK